MSAKVDELSGRLDAAIENARGRIKAFQTEAEQARQEVRTRFQKFLPVAEQIVALARQKLERLRERLKFDIKPSQFQTDRMYSRSATLDVKSDLASIVRLGFVLTHDADVRNILLDYNLEIIPIFFKFEPHARLEMPLESYNEAAVSKWLDDRLLDFANAYLELHFTKQYQDKALVSDPVAGISFPKHFAAATLDHGGTTYYFVSQESCREFAKREGLAP
jgi:YHS domain-containing protein